VHRVAFVVPRGVTWALPPYELALQLAAHANESTITPDETVATETAGLDILGEAFDLAGNKGTDTRRPSRLAGPAAAYSSSSHEHDRDASIAGISRLLAATLGRDLSSRSALAIAC
jgi:hypothetical protein